MNISAWEDLVRNVQQSITQREWRLPKSETFLLSALGVDHGPSDPSSRSSPSGMVCCGSLGSRKGVLRRGITQRYYALMLASMLASSRVFCHAAIYQSLNTSYVFGQPQYLQRLVKVMASVQKACQDRRLHSIWDVDQYEQLPWVRGKPRMGFCRGHLHRLLDRLLQLKLGRAQMPRGNSATVGNATVGDDLTGFLGVPMGSSMRWESVNLNA